MKSALAFAGCGAALVLLTGGGCELAVGDTVSAFTCRPDTLDPCPAGEVCDRVTRQCVQACTLSSCRGGLQCDPMSGYCVDASVPPPGDGSSWDTDASSNETSVVDSNSPGDTWVGGDTVIPPPDSSEGGCTGLLCPCGGDPQCASGVCANELDVGTPLFQAAGNVGFCTTPCCTSADCDASLVCFAASSSASAGSYCVPPKWLMRSTTLGTSTGGQSCSANTECRSGLCETTSGTCADTCCSTKQSSMECASGKTCGFGNFPGVATFDHNFTPLCGSFGPNANGSNCQSSNDCQSNLCTSAGFGGSCQDACRSSSDCAGQNYSCSFDHLSGSGVYGLCFPFQTGYPDGAACTHDAECQSNFCNGQMICSNICFANADCSQISSAHCRPEQVMISRGGGAASVLSCGM